jgi:alkylhydroperoxidase/carboxymuconolactone decarboxylase family protein YurZ
MAMHDRSRRAAGLKARRRVLGRAHVERAQARTTPLTADFQDLITRYAWGEIWTRPGLDLRTRRVLVLGTLVALRLFDEFALHARAALDEGGFSEADVAEVVLQQAVYCGVPAAHAAFEALGRVVDERKAGRRRT